MKKHLPLLALALAFLAFLIALVYILSPAPESGAANVHIGVVMYGSDDSARWDTLEQGIRQACRELDIENPVLTIAPMGDFAAQERLILQEAEAGAQGLLIAPGDSLALPDVLGALPQGMPYVLLENGAEGHPHVSADDAGMARLLAAQLSDIPGNVVLATGNPRRQSDARRQDAFLAAMAALGRPVSLLEDASAAALSLLPPESLLVALHTDTLDTLVRLRGETAAPSGGLYGIGSTSGIVSALNQDEIQGIVYQNEYAAGYIAMMRLAAALGLTRAPEENAIQYIYVNRDTMFQPELERLLFPIVH